MAKWGEGDPRWIVEERPDATNVNNWHWSEKNATPWSRERLSELLLNQTIEKGPVKITLKEFKKLEGDATANNRKAKLIFLYEWFVEVNFSASISGSEIEYKGTIEIPNFSDEYEAHEIDINIHMDGYGPHENELRHLINNEGLAFIRKQIGIYLKELKEEFSRDLIKPQGTVDKPQIVVKEATKIDKKSFQNKVVADNEKSSKPDTPTSLKSLELTQSFKASPDRIYEILTVPELVKAWAGTASSVNPTIGGEFSYFGGTFSGTITLLKENNEIKKNFRLKKFPAGYFAKVRFSLKDMGDSTDLKIEAEEIPENFYEEVQNGFSRYFLQSIGNAFNIGLKVF